MNRQPLQYADFGQVKFRLAYELRWCMRRGLGKIRVLVRWMAEPEDFALVVAQGYASEEKRRWMARMERESGVYDTRSRRFYWPRRTLERVFKHHESRV